MEIDYLYAGDMATGGWPVEKQCEAQTSDGLARDRVVAMIRTSEHTPIDKVIFPHTQRRNQIASLFRGALRDVVPRTLLQSDSTLEKQHCSLSSWSFSRH